MRKPPPLSEPTSELLRHERQLEPVSAEQRRRVLARARFATRMSGSKAALRRSKRPYLVATAVALGFGAAAFAALRRAPSPGPSAAEVPTARAPDAELQPVTPLPEASNEAPTTLTSPVANEPAAAPPRAPVGGVAKQASKAASDQELLLLERARTAVAQGSYSAALAAIDEHARRYPRGRLTEEREALRVTALWNSGQRTRAKQAAERFTKRFPRSVLSAQMAAKAQSVE